MLTRSIARRALSLLTMAALTLPVTGCFVGDRAGSLDGACDALEPSLRAHAVALATDAVNRLFSNDNPLLRLGRDLGMGAISAFPAARRAFIREAAGLTGTLPALMRD